MPRAATGGSGEGVSARVWSVPLAISEVPEAGRHLALVSDAKARAAVATLAGLAAVPRLEARFGAPRHGRIGVHVVGRVSATVGRACVMTCASLETEASEVRVVACVP